MKLSVLFTFLLFSTNQLSMAEMTQTIQINTYQTEPMGGMHYGQGTAAPVAPVAPIAPVAPEPMAGDGDTAAPVAPTAAPVAPMVPDMGAPPPDNMPPGDIIDQTEPMGVPGMHYEQAQGTVAPVAPMAGDGDTAAPVAPMDSDMGAPPPGNMPPEMITSIGESAFQECGCNGQDAFFGCTTAIIDSSLRSYMSGYAAGQALALSTCLNATDPNALKAAYGQLSTC